MTSVSPSSGVPAGGQLVRISGTGFTTPTAGVNATLPTGARISGTVTGPAGPLANICVGASGTNSYGSAVTAANGTYSINSLDPGTYAVHFQDCTATNSYVEPAPLSVTLAAGQALAGQDAALAQIPTGSISGTVTDSTGAPLAFGAYVSTTAGPTFTSSNIDAFGHFTLTSLRPDPNYTVNVQDTGGRGLAPTAAFAVQVVSGRDTPIGISLPAGGSISGTVTDSSGHPITNACVDISGAGQFSSTNTSTAGAFTVSGLNTGLFSIQAMPCGAGNYLPATASRTVTLGQAQTGVNLVLAAGGSISGRVTNGFGSPVPSICVQATSGALGGSSLTDSTGLYTLTGLGSASYSVAYSDCTESSLHYPTALRATPVAVTAGLATAGVDQSVGAPVAQGGAITGRVTDSAGTGIAGACVVANEATIHGYGEAFTDSTGAYRIGALAAGSYQVEFRSCGAGNYADQWYSAQSTPSAQTVAVATPPVSVSVGGASPWFTAVLSDTAIEVGMPAGSGVKDITVSNGGAASAVTTADRYTYFATPVVTGISPATAAAGTILTVSGTGFIGASAVLFGTQTATPTVVSDSSLTVAVPAGAAASTVDVVVQNALATSAASTADRFTYPGTQVAGAACNVAAGTTTTWNSGGSPYVVNCNVEVYGTLTLDATAGPIAVSVNGNYAFNIHNSAGSTVAGGVLQTAGTSAISTVSFAPSAANTSGWGGLNGIPTLAQCCSGKGSTIAISYTTITGASTAVGSSEYATGPLPGGRVGAYLDHLTIQGSSGVAINAQNTTLVLTNSTITGSGAGALFINIGTDPWDGFTFSGNSVKNTTGGYALNIANTPVTVSCSLFTGNSGGVEAVGGTTLDRLNLYGNASTGLYDASTTGTITATGTYWGPSGYQIVNVSGSGVIHTPDAAAPNSCAPSS